MPNLLCHNFRLSQLAEYVSMRSAEKPIVPTDEDTIEALIQGFSFTPFCLFLFEDLLRHSNKQTSIQMVLRRVFKVGWYETAANMFGSFTPQFLFQFCHEVRRAWEFEVFTIIQFHMEARTILELKEKGHEYVYSVSRVVSLVSGVAVPAVHSFFHQAILNFDHLLELK